MNRMDHPCDFSVEFDRVLSRINQDLISCCMAKIIPEMPVNRLCFSFTEIKSLCGVDLRQSDSITLFSKCLAVPHVEYVTRGKRTFTSFFDNLEMCYNQRELYLTLSPQALYYCLMFSHSLYNLME